MKKFIVISLFLVGFFVSAQEKGNPFSESEKVDQHANSSQADPPTANDAGNPPGDDDLPIDGYIPVLLVTALGIIIYQVRKQKQFN